MQYSLCFKLNTTSIYELSDSIGTLQILSCVCVCVCICVYVCMYISKIWNSNRFCLHFNRSIKFSQLLVGPTTKMNLFQSVTSALDNTLASDPTAGN